MGVGPHQRIRIGYPLFILELTPDRLAKIFQIDLMTNAGTRRHHAKAAKSLLAPFQKDIALVVTFHLQTDVFFKSVIITKMIDRHRVVDNEIDRRKWVNFGGVSPQPFYGFAHGGQINDSRNAGEVLHQYPGRAVGDFTIGMSSFQPARQRLNVIGGNRLFILPA
ncbi:hypothetical protein D3C78_933190 [compost metagenome]